MRIKIDADLALGFSKAELTELGKLGKTELSELGTEQCLWVSVKYWFSPWLGELLPGAVSGRLPSHYPLLRWSMLLCRDVHNKCCGCIAG